MFDSVLVANRGVIANRIIHTLSRLGVESIAVYHDDDFQADYVARATRAVGLGGGSVGETYLNAARLLEIAVAEGAQAIHPGYGFLSENADFAAACEAAGIAFIGPTAEQIGRFGLKHEARRLAETAGVPCIPGSALVGDLDDALAVADALGYPLMLKSTAGGGGIGMQVCHDAGELREAWTTVRQLAANFFADAGVFLEKYVADARHIEVQAFGDGSGTVVTLGERDCSAQRRNQKIIEETPAPNLPDDVREAMAETASRLLASVAYRNAGTVEFIYDTQACEFYFLEVNTRLQVEHGVTEEVFGVDLVECMVRQAAGTMPPLESWRQTLRPRGHSIQVRVYAEDPGRDFLPSPGLITQAVLPSGPGLRVESWVGTGCSVPARFDPMIAKLIAHASDRSTCLERLGAAMRATTLYGVETNLDYALSVLSEDEFRSGTLLTRSLAGHRFDAAVIRVEKAGTQTSIQDTGRPGYWHVGVPPSGPMDARSSALANALLGNRSDAPGLEVTLDGPTLRFQLDTVVALVGAATQATLDGVPVPLGEPVSIRAGATLAIGKVSGFGARAYLAVRDGLWCPEYLGSRSTFDLGQFGGHVGRTLQTGDVLRIGPPTEDREDEPVGCANLADRVRRHEAEFVNAESAGEWTLRVMHGPHGAPEYFTEDYLQTLFTARWEVHYNSSRTGIRLIGPKPEWVRETGGEAGLHPSNIHDTAYAFGTVDFTGDMPVILGPDGPSLGGFVCPATVIQADLWKLGQLRAGHSVRLVSVERTEAQALEAAGLDAPSTPRPGGSVRGADDTHRATSPIVWRGEFAGDEVVVRVAGDHFVLVELGPMELDIARRFRVHRLMGWLESHAMEGMRELTPGVRSLQIHFDSQRLPLDALLDRIAAACEAGSAEDGAAVPSRIVHLPLSWDDAVCRQAAEHYQQSVRADAPWCPHNLEFIRRINGLDHLDDVKQTIFDATYLVLGLGDVYLGAPVATPLDPRHRLVTTKYNPARTWTAENSVGIGGAYLCVYGMEGPGGYQLFGRTVQMWNRYRRTADFEQPWLLRFFDQIRFHEVSADALLDLRRRFELGRYQLHIEETTFDLARHEQALAAEQDAISAFAARRQAAFEAEMADWRARGLDVYEAAEAESSAAPDEVPDGLLVVESDIDGSVWTVAVAAGDSVRAGDTLCVVETMKMEIPVTAPVDGVVHTVHVHKGSSARRGSALLWLRPGNATNGESDSGPLP